MKHQDGQWKLDSLDNVNLHIARYSPIKGSCHIKTPTRLANKKAIINVKNEDDRCFEYSILASLYPAKNNRPNRVSHYEEYLPKLKTNGIEMPMATKDIKKFEKMNPYRINVYSCNTDGTNIQPRQLSKSRDKNKKLINLLMLTQDGKYHYTLITNLNKLLGHRGDTRLFCPFCCHGFVTKYGYNKQKLEQHKEEFSNMKDVGG